MRLFHGSNVEIDNVNLSKCMPNKDFGCGFYTTLLEEQAWRMAERRARIAGGIPIVTVYEVPDDLLEKPDLSCRVLKIILQLSGRYLSKIIVIGNFRMLIV